MFCVSGQQSGHDRPLLPLPRYHDIDGEGATNVASSSSSFDHKQVKSEAISSSMTSFPLLSSTIISSSTSAPHLLPLPLPNYHGESIMTGGSMNTSSSQSSSSKDSGKKRVASAHIEKKFKWSPRARKELLIALATGKYASIAAVLDIMSNDEEHEGIGSRNSVSMVLVRFINT
jgi:hypothetical protein